VSTAVSLREALDRHVDRDALALDSERQLVEPVVALGVDLTRTKLVRLAEGGLSLVSSSCKRLLDRTGRSCAAAAGRHGVYPVRF
jgi:hypothetical protein